MSKDAAQEEFRPFELGRYRVVRLLGVGGMGAVYLGELPGAAGFTKRVVLKVIHPQHAALPAFRAMFVDEAKVMLNLKHPNVVEVMELQEVGEQLYMVMEFVDGRDLHRLLKHVVAGGDLVPLHLAVHVMASLLAGLAHAHAALGQDGRPLNLVHRDVTPGNVLLSRTGDVKLTDFGVVRAEGRTTKTMSGEIKGKLRYMAPEVIRAEPLDARCDVFSAGVVAWELLTGHRLFTGKTDFNVMDAVVRAPIPAPSTLRAEIPAALDAAVLRALERDPAQRFESARAFRKALLSAVKDLDAEEAQEELGRLVARSIEKAERPVSLDPAGMDVDLESSSGARGRRGSNPAATPPAAASASPAPATPAHVAAAQVEPAPPAGVAGTWSEDAWPPPPAASSLPGAEEPTARLPALPEGRAQTEASLPALKLDDVVPPPVFNLQRPPSSTRLASAARAGDLFAASTPVLPVPVVVPPGFMEPPSTSPLVPSPVPVAAITPDQALVVQVQGQPVMSATAESVLAYLCASGDAPPCRVGTRAANLQDMDAVGRALMLDHLQDPPWLRSVPANAGRVVEFGVGKMLMAAASNRFSGAIVVEPAPGQPLACAFLVQGALQYTFKRDPRENLLSLFLRHQADGARMLPRLLRMALDGMPLVRAMTAVSSLRELQVANALETMSRARFADIIRGPDARFFLLPGMAPPAGLPAPHQSLVSLVPQVYFTASTQEVAARVSQLLSRRLAWNPPADPSILAVLGVAQEAAVLADALEYPDPLSTLWPGIAPAGTEREQAMSRALMLLEQCGFIT